jgi:hypothetical protein
MVPNALLSVLSRAVFLAICAASISGAPVRGQVMLSPVAVSGTDLGVYDDTVPLTNMINQSGVTVPFVTGSTPFDTYFQDPLRTFATNGAGNNWQSNYTFDLPLTGYVDFDLGESYMIAKVAVWNVSLKDVTITVRDDPNTDGTVAGEFTLSNHWNYPFSYPVDLLTFPEPKKGRYVRFAIRSAHTFSFNDTFAYANVGEVVMSVVKGGVSLPLSISLNTNGEPVITFTGALEFSSAVGGPYVAVPSNPQSPYTVEKGDLASQQYFRAIVPVR